MSNYKSPFPCQSVHRRHEPAATDVVWCDNRKIDDGSISFQFFEGKYTLITEVYRIKSDKQFASALSDNIRQYGYMKNRIIDSAQVKISNKVKDFLRVLLIDDY